MRPPLARAAQPWGLLNARQGLADDVRRCAARDALERSNLRLFELGVRLASPGMATRVALQGSDSRAFEGLTMTVIVLGNRNTYT